MTAAPSKRTAVVTGGASGIGLAVAERLVEEGLAVALFDRHGEAAVTAAAKIAAPGPNAMGVAADVTDRAAIAAGLEQVHERLGPVTVLVNSAGLDGFDRRAGKMSALARQYRARRQIERDVEARGARIV